MFESVNSDPGEEGLKRAARIFYVLAVLGTLGVALLTFSALSSGAFGLDTAIRLFFYLAMAGLSSAANWSSPATAFSMRHRPRHRPVEPRVSCSYWRVQPPSLTRKRWFAVAEGGEDGVAEEIVGEECFPAEACAVNAQILTVLLFCVTAYVFLVAAEGKTDPNTARISAAFGTVSICVMTMTALSIRNAWVAIIL